MRKRTEKLNCSVFAAMLLAASFWSPAAVPMERVETWDAGTTAGWTNESSRVSVANSDGSLMIAHLRQSLPAYAEETIHGPVPVGLRVTNVTFRFRSAHVPPSALRLVLQAWNGGRQWASPLVPPSADSETIYSVPVDFGAAKWAHGPGSSAAAFEQDMRLVGRVGLYIRRHVDTAEQVYRLDDFRVEGVYTEDVDGDGIPNTWEIEYGFNPELADGSGDPDGDGMNNYAEYRAGTDPNDAESFLRLFIDSADTESGVVLRWHSISNRSYRVWAADGSVTGLLPVAGNIPATPGINTFSPAEGGPGVRFYRIEVQ